MWSGDSPSRRAWAKRSTGAWPSRPPSPGLVAGWPPTAAVYLPCACGSMASRSRVTLGWASRPGTCCWVRVACSAWTVRWAPCNWATASATSNAVEAPWPRALLDSSRPCAACTLPQPWEASSKPWPRSAAGGVAVLDQVAQFQPGVGQRGVQARAQLAGSVVQQPLLGAAAVVGLGVQAAERAGVAGTRVQAPRRRVGRARRCTTGR